MTSSLVLLGILTLTSYQPVPAQTDSSPTWTSIGDRTTMFGCAVSQDMLRDGRVHYGDILYITGYGYRVVNDTMAVRHKNHVDLLVFTHREERAVGTRHVRIYRMEAPIELQAISKQRKHAEQKATQIIKKLYLHFQP